MSTERERLLRHRERLGYLARSDPRGALSEIQTLVELLCRRLAAGRGEPTSERPVPELIAGFRERSDVPAHIVAHLEGLLRYSEMANHDQAHAELDGAIYTEGHLIPCACMLDLTLDWFFRDHLGEQSPHKVTELSGMYRLEDLVTLAPPPLTEGPERRRSRVRRPTSPEILMARTETLLEKGQAEEAVATLERAIDRAAAEGDVARSVEACRRLLTVEPKRPDVVERLERWLATERRNDIEVVDELAILYARADRACARARQLVQAVRLQPDRVRRRVSLAEALIALGHLGHGASLLRGALAILAERGEWSVFRRVGERLLFLLPDDRSLRREMAQLYVRQRDYRRALTHLQWCYAASPDDRETLDMLCLCFEGMGRPDTAKRVRDAALP